MNQTNLFLDLEETIIDNWDSGLLINSAQIREYIEKNRIKGFRIFSFAIWTEENMKEFNKRHRRMLEKALDSRIIECNTCEEFRNSDTEFTGVRFDGVTDFISIRGKVGAFINWCESRFSGQHNTLIDDVVPNGIWHNQSSNTICKFIHIGNLS